MNFLLPYSFLFEIGLTAFLSHLHFHILQDLILHYVILFRIRLPTWGVHEWYWFLRTGFFPSALGYLNGLCVQLQVIGTLLIAINRATSLAFPHHYDKDLLMHYSLLFRIRLPTWGVYEFFWNVQEGVIPAILAVGYMFSVLFQELGTLLIAINRATSLTFPQHYEWFWSRYTWHTCIGCTLFCSLYTGPVFTDSSFFYRASWGYYIPYTLNQSPLTQALDNGYFPLCLSIVFICFLVNIYTCIRLYFHSRSMQRAINRREMAFHVLTVFQFIMQAVNTGDMVLVVDFRRDAHDCDGKIERKRWSAHEDGCVDDFHAKLSPFTPIINAYGKCEINQSGVKSQ
ncbi:unnamed protein product, partial [Mesorhabditis belari]|uniref:Serpentine receptor class gamma n=1 Tax=Mesorhabditis belari TaxID=2138241 RepID=A0AAF3EC02_9BILA